MKGVTVLFALLALLAACAGPTPPGVRQTQAMTDMDGRPIDPGPGAIGAANVGIGVWGGSGGGGIGFGMGW